MMNILKIENLSLKYPNSQNPQESSLALKDINLEVAEGEFVVILGASGCGKSSLLNALAGFLFPTSGRALVKGKEIEKPHPDRGMVFQKNALMPWLNVEENVSLGLEFAGMKKSERDEISVRALEWVGLQSFRKNYVYELSGGMQQRVGIARALATDPALLLLDEPLGALDAITRAEVQKVILDVWNKTEKTVLMVTHSIEEALFMATKLVIMTPRPGKIFKTYELNFSKEYTQGKPAKEIKEETSFLKLKKEVLEIVEEEAV